MANHRILDSFTVSGFETEPYTQSSKWLPFSQHKWSNRVKQNQIFTQVTNQPCSFILKKNKRITLRSKLAQSPLIYTSLCLSYFCRHLNARLMFSPSSRLMFSSSSQRSVEEVPLIKEPLRFPPTMASLKREMGPNILPNFCSMESKQKMSDLH